MRTTEERTETRTYKVTELKRVACDLCGKGCPSPNAGINSTGNWSREAYAMAEVVVRRMVGGNYPEGASVKETAYDICPECFDVLGELIAERGRERWGGDVKPTVKDLEW